MPREAADSLSPIPAPPPFMTAQSAERRAQHRRRDEGRVRDLLSFSEDAGRCQAAADGEARTGQQRVRNDAARREQAEAQRVEAAEERDRERRRELAEARRAKAAFRLEEERDQRDRIEREVRRICETSEELRDLERNLRVAYVNKDRAAQHQEKLLLRQNEEEREAEMDEWMEQDRQRQLEREEEAEREKRNKLAAQNTVLQRQIQENGEMRARAREEAARDKATIDDIVSRINLEDQYEAIKRNRKKEEAMAMVRRFQDEREHNREILAQEEKEQEEKIEAYNELTKQRQRKEEEEKKRIETEKTRRWKLVVEETRNQTQTKEEFDELRDLLYQEEAEAKRNELEEERIAMQQRGKEEMMRANQAQIDARKEVLARIEEEEKELVKEMMQKFSNDEEDERRKLILRMEAKDRFVEDVRQQRRERNRMFLAEKQKEEEDYKTSMLEEEYKRRVIAEARRRLLEKHAAQLRLDGGFLPPGTLANEEEAQILSRMEGPKNRNKIDTSS